MFKALLFDLDGTLIDTRKALFNAYKAAANFYGYDFTEVDFYPHLGKHYEEFLPLLIGTDNSEEILKVYNKKKEIFGEYAKYGELIKHVFEILKALHNNYKTAIVTTASQDAVEMWVKEFDLAQYFDLAITGSDVKNKKPDPEAYLVAAERLGVSPEECLVFEDGETGFEAARRAGMNYLDVRKKII